MFHLVPHIQKDFSTLHITGNLLPLRGLCSKSEYIGYIQDLQVSLLNVLEVTTSKLQSWRANERQANL